MLTVPLAFWFRQEEEKEALKADKKQRRLDPNHDVRMRKDHPDNREAAQAADEDDDAQWYRQEVGEEPEEGKRGFRTALCLVQLLFEGCALEVEAEALRSRMLQRLGTGNLRRLHI